MPSNFSSPRVPAEFEPHSGTYLLWPTRADNWREQGVPAQRAMVALANALAKFEPVTLGFSGRHAPVATDIDPTIMLWPVEYDDIWVRDTGPLWRLDAANKMTALDFRFNSWGGLFNSASNDDAVARQVAVREGRESVRSELVLEGGAIITDGQGTFFVTEESVLIDNRNPGLSRATVEVELRRMLGAQQFVWLPQGLAHDESGGHIDNICAFADRSTLLVVATDDNRHPSYQRVQEARAALHSARSVNGSPYRIIDVPLPGPTEISATEARGFAAAEGTIKRAAGTPLAPSHVNFYVANGVVVVPTFGCATDNAALEIIAKAFPNRRIIAVPSREFLLGGGAVHCVTRDIPAIPPL